MTSAGVAPSGLSSKQEIVARQGLRLPSITLKRLREAGIYCQPTISIEYQRKANSYVLRGVESGGAVPAIGAYCSFTDDQGQVLAWLQRIDSVGVNGVHAAVVAQRFIRLQMLRVQRTYDLLISRHELPTMNSERRPRLESAVIFHGRRGTLEMDLCNEEARFRGAVSPVFFSRSGELIEIPVAFRHPVTMLTAAVCCTGCHHCHLLGPAPTLPGSSEVDSPVS